MKSMLRAPENCSVNSSDDHYSNLDLLILSCLLGIPCCSQEMGKIVLWINLVFLRLFYLIYILGFERMRTRVGALKRKVNTTWYSWRFLRSCFPTPPSLALPSCPAEPTTSLEKWSGGWGVCTFPLPSGASPFLHHPLTPSSLTQAPYRLPKGGSSSSHLLESSVNLGSYPNTSKVTFSVPHSRGWAKQGDKANMLHANIKLLHANIKLLQLYPTLCNPMECSLLGFFVDGILQARILEWVAMPSFRGSSGHRDRTHISYVSCIGRQVLYH